MFDAKVDKSSAEVAANESKEEDEGISSTGAIMSVTLWTIGVGILALPTAVSVLGLIPCLAVMVLTVLINIWAGHAMIQAIEQAPIEGCDTIQEVAEQILGRAGFYLVSILNLMQNFLMIAMYLVVVEKFACPLGCHFLQA